MASAKYDKPSILLRESIQNSCDARLKNFDRITFSVELSSFGHEGRHFLQNEVFKGAIPQAHRDLIDYLKKPRQDFLVIADSHTTGLDGFLDPSDHGNYGNFLKFFFVYGSNEEKESISAGGTAGVGRTIFFSASKANTILVFTRVIHQGKPQARFMAATSGAEVKHENTYFTGRHWWGNVEEGRDYPMPIIGEDAEEIMANLGLEMHLPQGQTGTVIVILDPIASGKKYVDEQTDAEVGGAEEIVERMARATEIFAWPHILDSTVEFTFTSQGKEIELRDPNSIIPIRYYCIAYKNLKDAESPALISMTDRGKKYDLGLLTYTDWPSTDNRDDFAAQADFIPENSVALMRQAKFVVKYMPIESRANGITTRGVFLSNPGDPDKWFRESEPAAHDDWLPEKLGIPDRQANPINICFRKIKQFFKNISANNVTIITGSAAGDLARIFGSEISGTGSWGPEDSGAGGNSGGGKKSTGVKRKVQLQDFGFPKVLKRENGLVNIEFLFTRAGVLEEHSGVKVSYKVNVLTADGTVEVSPPLGEHEPRVLETRDIHKNTKLDPAAIFDSKSWPGGSAVIVQAPANALIQCEGQIEIVSEDSI